MHTLPETLLAAQQKPDRLPTAVVKVTNRFGGVVQPDWETLYTGAEPAGPHAAAIAPDGSLLRARITPASDTRRLYRQRVAGPGTESANPV